MQQIQFLEEKFKDLPSSIDFIQKILYQNGTDVLICAKSPLTSIQRIFKEYNLQTSVISTFSIRKPKTVNICNFSAEQSFVVGKSYFLTEEMIFGRVVASIKKKEISQKRQIIIANGFTIGDIVVHKKYGIAKFEGLTMVENQGKEYDTAKLIYADGDILYIPVTNINLVTKYGVIPEGIDVENLLDKLHTNGFANRRAKVKKNLFEIAEKLIQDAAKRKQTEAFLFFANETTKKFDDQFLYTLTEDQISAIEDCGNDLSSGKIMERLICGDVGFGKTEVAMRACSLVLFDGQMKSQVCVICPTTLLAGQHFKTFSQRFNGFDCKVAKITRTTSSKERKEIIEKLKIGEIDILIATHAGFNSEISFKNLQLLIIDEEQHFGVEQKEKMKAKFNCHVLLLSATPIPRTLQMGLSGLKDISIIATPPFDRLLPQTQVLTFDKATIANAIIREKMRGGRTFFVCPRVSDIEEQMQKISAITNGEVSIGVAHGGMPPKELETIMDKFYNGVYDVLCSTSIVESGIDISFANTMIIHRSEMFGLSALYQLRGRVGRGKTQSFVYFLISDINRITETAKQRLKAISNISSLGEGMKIAVSDLDIRGAGNIVGKEQSGKINEIGTELYEQMLKEAIMEMKSNVKTIEEDVEPEIKISIPFFIPENYIPDFDLRMQIYREISGVNSTEGLDLLRDDIIDRFGKIPESVSNLIQIVKIKIDVKKLCISKFEIGLKGVLVQFGGNFQKNEELLNFVIKNAKTTQIKSANSVLFLSSDENLITKAYKILKLIESL